MTLVQDNLYFIMDYCAGGEFFRMLQKQPGKCLPEDHVKFYCAEVLLALEVQYMMINVSVCLHVNVCLLYVCMLMYVCTCVVVFCVILSRCL